MAWVTCLKIKIKPPWHVCCSPQLTSASPVVSSGAVWLGTEPFNSLHRDTAFLPASHRTHWRHCCRCYGIFVPPAHDHDANVTLLTCCLRNVRQGDNIISRRTRTTGWSYQLLQKHLLIYSTKMYLNDFHATPLPSSHTDIWYLVAYNSEICQISWETVPRKKVRYLDI